MFSEKENSVVHWALLSLGIDNVPLEHKMKDVSMFLQRLCRLHSIWYKGSLGHVYYVNDLAGIIVQVSNRVESCSPPLTWRFRKCPTLTFIPTSIFSQRTLVSIYQGISKLGFGYIYYIAGNSHIAKSSCIASIARCVIPFSLIVSIVHAYVAIVLL